MRNQTNQHKLSKNEWIAITIAIVVVGWFLVLGPIGLANIGVRSPNITDQALNEGIAVEPDVNTELQISDVTTGTGEIATENSAVTVHYTGYFADGTVFDSSQRTGEPFSVQLGVGRVIEGWDEGIPGMRVGGTRTLVIPPDLAYGERGFGPIPPSTTLYFEITLLSIDN